MSKTNAGGEIATIEIDSFFESPQPAIRIRSGQMKDDVCNYSYDQRVQLGVTNNFKVASQVRFHEDLKKAFEKFNPHLAVICEEVSHKDIRDIDNAEGKNSTITDKLRAFSVDSFKATGSIDDGGVILIGQKLLSTGESVKLETPNIEFNSKYEFTEELYAAYSELVDQLLQYHEGKTAPDPQQVLEFGNENEMN